MATSDFFASLTPASRLTRDAMHDLTMRLSKEDYEYPHHRLFVQREAGSLAASVPSATPTTSSEPWDAASGLTTEADDSDYDDNTYKKSPCYAFGISVDKWPFAATGEWFFGLGDSKLEAVAAGVDLVLPRPSAGLIYPRHGFLKFDGQYARFWLHARHRGITADGVRLNRNDRLMLDSTTSIEIGPYKFIFQFKVGNERNFQLAKAAYIKRCNNARGVHLHTPPPSTSATPTAENIKIGSWLIHDIVGASRDSIIHAASNVKTGKVVAVKRLRIDAGDSSGKKELNTYRDIKRSILNHKYTGFVMQLHSLLHGGHGVATKEVFMLWEPLALGDFSQFGITGKWLQESMETKRILFFQIICGLSALHDCGWIHRDLKPDNLGVVSMLPEPRAVILDTGRAIVARREGHEPRVGHCGTVGYLAPELENPLYASKYHSEVDIFSLGVVAFCLFLGRKIPWSINYNMFVPSRNERHETLHIFKEELRELRRAPAGSVEALIAKMLNPDPSRRPSTGKLLADPVFEQEATFVRKFIERTGEKRAAG